MRLTDFHDVLFVDTEFRSIPGERPNPICLCALSGITRNEYKIWLTDGAPTACPIPNDSGVLFVCYSARAELGVYLALGWALPVNVLDLHVEHLRLTNGQRWESCKLASLCRQLGFPSPANEHKEQMRRRIIDGPPFASDERENILTYCLDDARFLAAPLKALFGQADVDLAIRMRGEFMRVVARMEHHGIPIDVGSYEALRLGMPAIWQDFVVQMDKHHLYEGGSFRHNRLDQLVRSFDLPWPRTEMGNLRTDELSWAEMAALYPDLIGPYTDLRHIASWLRFGLDLRVGSDGRSRPNTMPFVQKAGRTSPSGSFIFSHPKWLRSLLKPEPSTALLYADYSQQEPALASFFSGDPGLRRCYHNPSGSFYIALMVECGMAPRVATKKSHPKVHSAGKVLLLAISYGAGPDFVARRLGLTVNEAKEMLRKLLKAFPIFFAWREDVLLKARLLREIETPDGWRQYVDSQSNPRSIYNYPMQSCGAAMTRCAAILADKAGIRVLATVHDALLCEADADDLDARSRLGEAMSAGAELLAPGFGIRHETEYVTNQSRYLPVEPAARAFWDKVMDLLAKAKASNSIDVGINTQTR
jgi:DNA polymerase-1